jgi:CRP-like cAMP-binding protein
VSVGASSSVVSGKDMRSAVSASDVRGQTPPLSKVTPPVGASDPSLPPFLDSESEALAVLAEDSSSEKPLAAAAPAESASNSFGSKVSPGKPRERAMLKAASSFWQLTTTGSDHVPHLPSPMSAASVTPSSPARPADADEWMSEALAAKSAVLQEDEVMGERVRKKRRNSVLPETVDALHEEGAAGPHIFDDVRDVDAPENMPVLPEAGEAEPSLPTVKNATQRQLIARSLTKSFLFRALGRQEREAIVEAMGSQTVPSHTVLTREDEPASMFHVVESGSVLLEVKDVPIARIGPEGHFGEMQLMFQTPAQATIKTIGPCTLWSISRRHFRKVLAAASAKTAAENQAFLRMVPLLRTLEPAKVVQLAEACKMVDFESGHAIVKQGGRGQVFYIVRSGECTVYRHEESEEGAAVSGDEVEVMRLREGMFFGEQALLHNQPRGATVITSKPTTVLALSKEDFDHILGPVESLAAEMNRTHSQRQEMEAAARSRVSSMRKPSPSSRAPKRPSMAGLSAADLGATAVAEEEDEDDDEEGVETPKSGVVPLARPSHGSSRAAMPVELVMAANSMGSGNDLRAKIIAQGRDAANARSMAAIVVPSSEHAPAVVDEQPKIRTIPSAAAMTTSGKPKRDDQPPTVDLSVITSPTTQAAMAAGGKAVGGLPATQSFRSTRPEIRLESLKIRAVLGEGAFGRVMLAQDPASEELFALKQMSKARIVKTGQKKNVLNEKAIMMRLDHPHIIRLFKTFQDKDCLYVLVEFAQGGDLFGLLGRVGGTVNVKVARYYAGVVASVFRYMHGMNIIYRDLKPENLCLMATGALKVVDFGFAKLVLPGERSYTLCGTPEYLAPELISGVGHHEGVDWWALGILLYEMLHGYSPFSDPDTSDHRVIYRNILKGRYDWQARLKEEADARSLVAKLLESNPARRLGSLRGGAKDVMSHRFFSRFDWDAIERGEMKPPLRPKLKSATDVSAFDEVETRRNHIDPYVPDGTKWDASF